MWAIVISAVAGAISIAAGFVAGIVGYRVSDLTQKETSAQIAEANARAAEANARAAEANLALEIQSAKVNRCRWQRLNNVKAASICWPRIPGYDILGPERGFGF